MLAKRRVEYRVTVAVVTIEVLLLKWPEKQVAEANVTAPSAMAYVSPTPLRHLFCCDYHSFDCWGNGKGRVWITCESDRVSCYHVTVLTDRRVKLKLALGSTVEFVESLVMNPFDECHINWTGVMAASQKWVEGGGERRGRGNDYVSWIFWKMKMMKLSQVGL